MQTVMNRTKLVSFTPTLGTIAYTSADRLGSINTFDLDFSGANAGEHAATLQEVRVFDAAVQSAAFDILFFDALPTVASADNAAIDITDAEMLAKCIGHVSILAADYCILANSSIATKRVEKVLIPASGAQALWAVLVARGTPTYAADSLKISLYYKFDQMKG